MPFDGVFGDAAPGANSKLAAVLQEPVHTKSQAGGLHVAISRAGRAVPPLTLNASAMLSVAHLLHEHRPAEAVAEASASGEWLRRPAIAELPAPRERRRRARRGRRRCRRPCRRHRRRCRSRRYQRRR